MSVSSVVKKLFQRKEKVVDEIPPLELTYPRNDDDVMANILRIKEGEIDAAVMVGRMLKAAFSFWQKRTSGFSDNLSTQELRIVLSLLGGNSFVAYSPHSGKSTGIGLAALAHFLTLDDARQAWVVPEGSVATLVKGPEHEILREFLSHFGVQLRDGASEDYQGLSEIKANVIPIFTPPLVGKGDRLKDYLRTIWALYLDNVYVPVNSFPILSPGSRILAVGNHDLLSVLAPKVRGAHGQS